MNYDELIKNDNELIKNVKSYIEVLNNSLEAMETVACCEDPRDFLERFVNFMKNEELNHQED